MTIIFHDDENWIRTCGVRYEFDKDEFAPEKVKTDVNLVLPHGCWSDSRASLKKKAVVNKIPKWKTTTTRETKDY